LIGAGQRESVCQIRLNGGTLLLREGDYMLQASRKAGPATQNIL
jgi:hypothetical protein